MAKHEVLSTAFVYKNVSSYRQVLTDRHIPVIMEDATGADNMEAFINEIRTRETSRGFDLQDDALLRIVCVKTSDASCKLMLFFHHIIIDGWCLHLVFADLKDIFAKHDMTWDPSNLADLTMGYIGSWVYDKYYNA